MRKLQLTTLLAALLLWGALTACGDKDDTPAANGTEQPAPAPDPDPTPDPDPDPEPDPEPEPEPEPEPDPTPGRTVVAIDFAEGPGIAAPALPGSSEQSLTGRGDYLIAGHKFAVYADGAVNGKYFWVDNAQYSANIPEPNKGLFFSKTGAYVELPALAGKALVEAVYTSTTSANGTVELELTDTDGTMIDQSVTPHDDGLTQTFAPVAPQAGVRYRLTVVNKKNAQMARLTLAYDPVP